MQDNLKSGERSVVITLQDKERKYLAGHVIDGRNLFPAMGYLVSSRIQYLANVVMRFPRIYLFGPSSHLYDIRHVSHNVH